LWKLTGNRELFVEAMQNALLGMWQNVEKLNDKKAGAYIYRIALTANSKAWRNRIGRDGQIGRGQAGIEEDPAAGYDFRADSRAIAYIKPEDEFFDTQKPALGSLVERTVIDPNGRLLASLDSNDPLQRYTCTGAVSELAGVLYHPWMHVSYAGENRIFFASSKMSLPSSKLDEEKTTIFCYDTLTGALSEIVHQVVLDATKGNVNLYLFALSHDSRKILLNGKKNTVGIYALGGDLSLTKILIDEEEGFGEGESLIAQWKGPDRLSCLVSEKSHYLTNDPNTPARRKEIVILDANGNLQQILSKDWPDELLNY
jgi:hypothetical protein